MINSLETRSRPDYASAPGDQALFITTPDAAQLVVHAGAMAKGGDVLVLDMGESIKIMDLPRCMIEFLVTSKSG